MRPRRATASSTSSGAPSTTIATAGWTRAAASGSLAGDAGNDTLTGGTGADAFYIGAGHGADVVTDFNRAQGDAVDAGADYTASQQGANVLVQLSDGTSLTLLNTQLSSLDSGWII